MFTDTVYSNNAEKWLVAFYGYGQSASVYKQLSEQLKNSHNLLVIDNPMQDYTNEIKPHDLQDYLDHRLGELGVQSFSSASFSMGSRMNLYLPLFYPNQLENLFLIAPDGIVINFWNRIAMGSIGNKFFRFFVKNGNIYLAILRLVYIFGIINKSLYAFSKWKMRDAKQRKNVYNAWMNLRLFTPQLEEVNTVVEKNKISLITYFGKEDKVIPKCVQKKCSTSFPNGNHFIINTNHDLLNKELFKKMAGHLNKL